MSHKHRSSGRYKPHTGESLLGTGILSRLIDWWVGVRPVQGPYTRPSHPGGGSCAPACWDHGSIEGLP